MDTVGSYQAKTDLPRLLQRVAQGERITITKHGVPVAMLVPVSSAGQRRRPAEVVEELLAFRQRHPLGQVSLRDLIDEGRRW